MRRIIHYHPFFRLPRRIIRYLFSGLYPIAIRVWKMPKIATIEETIFELLDQKKSIIRFGDGEMLFIARKLSLPFQRYNSELASSLQELLKVSNENLLVGIPDAYRSLDDFTDELKPFWRSQITYNYPSIFKLLDQEKQYFNANITRLYFGYKDHERSKHHFELMRRLWEKQEILLIEGEKSRLGVGNDLFANAKSVERILGPAHHAFDKVEELFNEAMKHSTNKLLLVAMGPTAKVLVYRLASKGYQAIDIGNLDLEYEWYLRGVKERVLIPGKYVSEVKGGRDVEEVTDQSYLSQIVSRCL